MAQRILVTGGAGFVGSHLCARLLSEGHDVLCLDDFSTGSERNAGPLLERRGFALIRHDVTAPIAVEADAIYNLACPASPRYYQADPVRTLRTSIEGALNVLALAETLGVPVLQASTSEVYGDPAEHPQRENYWGNVNPVGPRACYDEGKRAAETLFSDYRRHRGVDTRIARIFNTYGPQMHRHDGRVVSNFIVQALKGEDITVYGDGRQSRSFCYVDDLVDGLVRLMERGAPGPVNLGNPEEYSVRELAETIVNMTGSTSRIVQRDLPVDDPRQRQPDITLARELLGWAPRVPLREGLARTIAYFEGVLAEPA
ncbi:MAG TPA: UDP-glucuronic acid decarboxylase family protein [Devosia sp.]|nr:UDP-glucuronic acid decarboxylase family protein [Devosia sp.]